MPSKSKVMKAPKAARSGYQQSHVADTPFGMGDSYGTGKRQNLGTMREGTGMRKLSKAQKSKPPKSLA